MTDTPADAHITFWSTLLNNSGRPAILPWGRLFIAFSNWKPFQGDEQHPGWSPARFEPCVRGLNNVRGVSALVLDYDGLATIEEAEAFWKGTYGYLHTTRKSAHEANRFRVILPFTREVTPDEFKGIWRRVFEKCGRKLDPAPKDPSRFWFTPGCEKEFNYVFRWLNGQLMDPDIVLAEPDPEAPGSVVGDAPKRVRREATAYDRASAYLAKMPQAISGSAGQQALWSAALAAVKGFSLSESEALQLLESEYNLRCQPPWRTKDLEHKVRDAAKSAKVPDGYKLDEGRDWKPTSASVPRADPDAEVVSDAPEGPADPALDPVRHYGVRTVAELLNGVYTLASTNKPRFGCPSGNDLIDRSLGGFRRGMVTVLGAPTSWGKSSFAIMVVDACLAAGKRILMVSGEDSETTYGQRLMARRANIHAMHLRDSKLSTDDFTSMANILAQAENEPIFLNGIGKPTEFLSEAIVALCAKRDIDLVIVDYLQAFSCTRRCQDRRVEVTHIARSFIDAIKSSGTSGLVLSQLKRLKDDAQGSMHDLKESGDIENFAEHVLIGSILHHGANEDSWRRMIGVQKNKDGPRLPRPVELQFDERTASFTGLTLWDN